MEEIKIQGVYSEGITEPDENGLYAIPFKLNRNPSNSWRNNFIQIWASPPEWIPGHHPEIAEVIDDRIVLNGTTIEDFESVYKRTLEICIKEANKATGAEIEAAKQREKKEEAEHERRVAIKRDVQEKAKKIKFD